MKRIFTAIIATALLAGCAANPPGEVTDVNKLTSPDGNMEMTFHLTAEGTPQYALSYEDQKVILPSNLGFELRGVLKAQKLIFNEDAMTVSFAPAAGSEPLKWALEFNAYVKDNLPFTKITDKAISASYKGYDYNVRLTEGKFSPKSSDFANWHILPQNGRLVLSGVLK